MSKSHLWAFAVLCLMVFTVACGGGGEAPATDSGDAGAPAADTAPAADPGSVGTVAGTILYTGGEDPDTVIDMAADPNCQALHSEPIYTEQVVAGAEGGLANVFVYVKSGVSGSYPAPAEPVVLNQEGCHYTPHVFGIQVGQEFIIRNSDETLHNVHASPSANEEFNQGQPFAGMELKKTFDQVEVMVPFKCDVHPWMSAFAGVVNHPFFAVTGEDGSFSIPDLPAGTYTVEAWHEHFGTQTAEITVDAGGSADFSFDYAASGE